MFVFARRKKSHLKWDFFLLSEIYCLVILSIRMIIDYRRKVRLFEKQLEMGLNIGNISRLVL